MSKQTVRQKKQIIQSFKTRRYRPSLKEAKSIISTIKSLSPRLPQQIISSKQWKYQLQSADTYECGFLAPLAIPLSGVMTTLLCKKGKKTILLIGERHASVSDDKSFPSITDVIIPFLKNGGYVGQGEKGGHKIDFMLEHTNTYYESEDSTDRKDFIDSKPYKDEAVMNRLRYLLSPYIFGENKVDGKRYQQFNTSRVHWLDKEYTEESPNWLLELQDCKNNYKTEISKCNTPLLKSTIIDPAANMIPGNFARHMSKLLKTLPDFIKCNNRSNFITGSIEQMFKDLHNHLELTPFENTRVVTPKFLFLIQRCIMDVYTMCKLLKPVTNGWYTNIVVYAGQNHTLRVGKMLNDYGFNVRKVNLPQDDPRKNIRLG